MLVMRSMLGCMLACAVAATGCSKKDGESSAGGEAQGEAAETASAADKSKSKRQKKDRGEASMKLGETEWQAESARPRLKDGKLSISASQTDMSDGKIKRQELQLTIKDFKGPGEYTLQMTDAMFIGVGMDMDKAKAAAADGEEATKKAAADMLGGSEMLMMPGAVVTIESANDKEVTGTFSWTPPPHDKNKPTITDGKFRAVYRD